jgi:preprotein translocase subunit SecE
LLGEKILSETRMKNTIAAQADDQPERKKPSSGPGALAGIASWPNRTKSFLAEVRTETKRVTWPNLNQIWSTTIVVLITVFFFGVYFGLLDWVFNDVVRRLLKLGS